MIRLNGIWDDGYVIDNYISKSEYIGDDVFGHPQFNNAYTEIGALLHSMKYNGHYDRSGEIVSYCEPLVRSWLLNKHVDILLPVPPSIRRSSQPVFVIAKLLADRLGISYSDKVLTKIISRPVKSVPKSERDLIGAIKQMKPAKRQCSILLFDDFYSTGRTASECVSVLKKDKLVDAIYFLAIARTK